MPADSPASTIQVWLADLAPARAAQEGSQRGWALTARLRTPTIPTARSGSASSMQSPPASAEATRRQHPVPSVRPPRRSEMVKVVVDEFPQTLELGEGGWQQQTGIGHHGVVLKDDANTGSSVPW